jgi:hypothetical protein
VLPWQVCIFSVILFFFEIHFPVFLHNCECQRLVSKICLQWLTHPDHGSLSFIAIFAGLSEKT